MSIPDITKKINPYLQEKVVPILSSLKSSFIIKEDIFIVLVIILIGLAGFGLGKLSALEKSREPVKIQPANFTAITASSTKKAVEEISLAEIPMSASIMIASETAKGMLVASKTGKKYHFPWCAGASQIADKNKIWFNSYEAAQNAGYTAAANCLNLK